MNLYQLADSDEDQKNIYTLTFAFLRSRLEEHATINWALSLGEAEIGQKLAILQLLDSFANIKISKPWYTAWRMVEEYWQTSQIDRMPLELIRINRRLDSGERSASLIKQIVQSVEARLKLEPLTERVLRSIDGHKIKTIQSIFHASITSNELSNPSELKLRDTGPEFLISLARALEASIAQAFDLATRLGWKQSSGLWTLGNVHYVAYGGGDGGHDSDSYSRGIAPSVKLLHTVIQHLGNADPKQASIFVDRWRDDGFPIHLRLWASLSRATALQSADKVYDKIASLQVKEFWDVSDFPEIAELRARRFNEFSAIQRDRMSKRLMKGPPKSFFNWVKDIKKLPRVQLYWAIRELLRIRDNGGTLPNATLEWLEKNNTFTEFDEDVGIDVGFSPGPRVIRVSAIPDQKYSSLVGSDRLEKLEEILEPANDRFFDSPTRGAEEWLRADGNAKSVINDLLQASTTQQFYPNTFNEVLYAHSYPQSKQEKDEAGALSSEASTVVHLLLELSNVQAREVIEAATFWLSRWKSQVILHPDFMCIWERYWPLALAATNITPNLDDISSGLIDASARDEGEEYRNFDTLNNAVGQMVGLFIEAWSVLPEDVEPFEAGSRLCKLRDDIIRAEGKSGRVAKYRLLELNGYFYRNAKVWTQKHLWPLLLDNSRYKLLYWKALSHRRLIPAVMNELQDELIRVIVEPGLARRVKQHLLFGVVVEGLHSFKAHKTPPIPHPKVSQMLRTVDDELRATGADAIQRFLKDNADGKPATAATFFKRGAKPFIESVWPQERALVTEGTTRAFADIPAASGTAFVDAVNTIERLIIPFNCWSLIEYGLYDTDDPQNPLSQINTAPKARALLRLLSLTIGPSVQHTIPHDLSVALERIREVAPEAVNEPSFLRLLTLSR